MKNYFSYFYSSFKKIYGYILLIIGILLSIIFWIWKPEDSISLKLIIPLAIFVLLLIITLFDLSYTFFQKHEHLLPKVIQGREPPSFLNESKALLLVEKSELFSHEALISLFQLDQGYGKLVGLGYVLAVQNDGIIQIIITKSFMDNDVDFWDRVTKNDNNIIKNLIVKPNIPKTLFPSLFSEIQRGNNE